MSPRPVPPVSRHRRGVALVIVLAFVLLLTGLIVAFFSRAVSKRQISDSSANETRIDVFAAGAVNTILGDFHQEIAAGSNSIFYTDLNGNVVAQVYQPFSSATGVPAQALKGSTSEQSGINFSNASAPPYAPNLVKRSAYSQNFFPGGGDPGGGNYNNGNTAQTIPVTATPSTVPPNAPSYAPSNRAANVASTAVSQNGRFVSLARWNKPLLLPKNNLASDTDFTPLNPASAPATVPSPYVAPPSGTSEFVAPDWVLVARDGSNPTGTFSSAMVTSASNSTSVVGRYAYAVYDEGGLLDANAAGFPNAGGTPTVPLSNSPLNLPLYKGSATFADLKQLPAISALSNTSADRPEQVVRTLLGWRNYASTAIDPTQTTPTAGSPVTGSVNVAPGYQWSPANLLNFLNSAPLNSTGYLRTANPLPVNGPYGTKMSDRIFSSRQQLLALLTQSVADQSTNTNAAAERANLQNAMQYLGTFNRALNQPSYAPPPGRPKVTALTSGGNLEGPGNDDKINPAFLDVRATSTVVGGRNDGTDLVLGEPLVKKRFPLSRLAWLTYKGPSYSTNRAGTDQTDLNDLKTNFGYTQAFLEQGTPANIQKYFGLTWSGSYWTFGFHANASGYIKTLAEVQADNREPDFIELLKAAVTVGALGKSGAQSGSVPVGIQFTRDGSIDCQVIQITANIIDQFDVDGFPTRIQFPAYSREFRGVENLPYFYRARNALYRIVNPTPPPPDTNADQYTIPDSITLNPGAFVMVQQPEIWNPHAYASNSTNTAIANRSLGNPRPQKLQLVVYGGAPILPIPQIGGSNTVFPRWRGSNIGNSVPGNGLSPATTAMTFLNAPALYREPTLLIKPNVPAGSSLQAPGFLQAATTDHLDAHLTGGGITVLDSAAQGYTLNGGAEPNPTGTYFGVYLGSNVVAVGTTDSKTHITTVDVAGQANVASPSSFVYQVQCESANVAGAFDAYDQKYFSPEPFTDGLPYNRGMMSVSDTDPNTYSGKLVMGLDRLMTGFDPRTSRFGILNSSTADGQFFQDQEFAIPGSNRSPGAPKWIDRANNVVPTNRLDACAGFGMGDGSGNQNVIPGSGPAAGSDGWTWDGALLRFGLFSQNNPAIPNDNYRFYPGDTHANSMGKSTAQYYSDADGVVRRAMGAYVQAGTVSPVLSANTKTGLPMATAYYAPLTDTSQTVDSRQNESRPIILNRPFRTVAELGYVFSDTPWKNIDLSTPESGYAPLLDVFCVNDTDDSRGMVAGKVDLNTRQTPVLQAVLSGAYKDEYNGVSQPLSPSEAQTLAGNLYKRTTSTASGKGPLASLTDLVGGWKSGSGTSAVYDGFSADLDNPDPTRAASNPDLYNNNIPRYRESAIRALTAAGNTRVWNLLIDLVAQTGRYPQSASGLDRFVVEGEQRCWVHVAIDRYTGQIIDKQIEIIKE